MNYSPKELIWTNDSKCKYHVKSFTSLSVIMRLTSFKITKFAVKLVSFKTIIP